MDDRPPPTAIHVAPFREDSPEFMAFGTHAQRAAVKLQHPGIVIVFGPGDLSVQNGSTSANSVNVLEAPPSYEHATQQGNGTTQTATAGSPQRTVLQAEDGLL
ncbi:hypothetical protein ANCDUO_02021 [Ancylostoma duodenale]|uniref:Uncharacterized protein n=1 Tax=Ancylostoma duodenale TaxID=51022 RepID=A0A0C2H1J8_9BILA|nr:hypothetical protein ANCDUO_02021 [Ancylostoma duodenale]